MPSIVRIGCDLLIVIVCSEGPEPGCNIVFYLVARTSRTFGFVNCQVPFVVLIGFVLLNSSDGPRTRIGVGCGARDDSRLVQWLGCLCANKEKKRESHEARRQGG
jgi:hypothetical protein